MSVRVWWWWSQKSKLERKRKENFETEKTLSKTIWHLGLGQRTNSEREKRERERMGDGVRRAANNYLQDCAGVHFHLK